MSGESGTRKKVAIITGAAGGLGKAFIEEILKEHVDELWCIGRNREKLDVLKERFGHKIVPICADLTVSSALEEFCILLERENAEVCWLINNAGVARMAASKDFKPEEIEKTVALNCKIPALLINYCLPYMEVGAKILNVSSASAFQPTPYLNLYAATKAFGRSYSRGLNAELKSFGITATAVCPGWIDTDMLTKEINGKKVRFPGLVKPERVAAKAVKDAKKGKDMSVCSFYVKRQHFWVKLMPQRLTMAIWTKSVKKYL